MSNKLLTLSILFLSTHLGLKIQCMDFIEEYNKIEVSHNSALKKVHCLRFQSMNIDDESAKTIAIGIKYNTVLYYVDLNHNNITEEGIKYLALSLANKPITQFHMHGSKIGDKGHVFLAEAIKTWHGLTHLNLNETDLGDVGIEALGDALKNKEKLLDFYVYSGNKVSKEGAKNFFKKIANFGTISN